MPCIIIFTIIEYIRSKFIFCRIMKNISILKKWVTNYYDVEQNVGDLEVIMSFINPAMPMK